MTITSRTIAAAGLSLAVLAAQPQTAQACESVACVGVTDIGNSVEARTIQDSIPKHSTITTSANQTGVDVSDSESADVNVYTAFNDTIAFNTFDDTSSRTEQNTLASGTNLLFDNVVDANFGISSTGNNITSETEGRNNPTVDHDTQIFGQAIASAVTSRDSDDVTGNTNRFGNSVVSTADLEGINKVINTSSIEVSAGGSVLDVKGAENADTSTSSLFNSTTAKLDLEDSHFRPGDNTARASATGRQANFINTDSVIHYSRGFGNLTESVLDLDGSKLALSHDNKPGLGFDGVSFAAGESFNINNSGLDGDSDLDLDVTSTGEKVLSSTFARNADFGFGVKLTSFAAAETIQVKGVNDVDINTGMFGSSVEAKINTTGSTFNFSNQEEQGTTINAGARGTGISISGANPNPQ